MIKRKALPITGIVVLALLSMEFACSANSYDKAGQLAKDFAASVLVAQEVEINAHKTGYIDDQTHQAIQSELLQIADAGGRLDHAINISHNTAGAATELKVIVQLLQDLSQNKLIGIKNANTKLALQAALLTAQTTIDNIIAFGGK